MISAKRRWRRQHSLYGKTEFEAISNNKDRIFLEIKNGLSTK